MSYSIEDIEQNTTVTIKLLHYRSTDSDDLNLSILKPEEKIEFQTYKSEKRQLEFYYTRLLWKTFQHSEDIQYRPTGKPTLKQGYLSISHSHQFIAIAYSDQFELGIDIEPVSEKINRVQHKFLHPKEIFENLEDLTKAWCIKEAVYKLMDMDDVFFMDDIFLDSVENDQFALIDIEGITIKPQFKVRILKHQMMMALAFHPHS